MPQFQKFAGLSGNTKERVVLLLDSMGALANNANLA